MQSINYGEYLIQLTRLTAFNCFLVREDDGFTLVDTNLPGSAHSILKAAKQAGGAIRRIVLTHAHQDHVGSLDELHALLPDAEIAISPRDARFLRGDMSLDSEEPQTPLRGSYVIRSTQPTRLLKAGDRVGSLEVIASPGHTPGHISFFDNRNRALIAGDAFSTKAGIATGGTVRWLFPFPALASWHQATMIQSAETLIKLQPAYLAVGHGKVLENPVLAMEQAIADAQRQSGAIDHAT